MDYRVGPDSWDLTSHSRVHASEQRPAQRLPIPQRKQGHQKQRDGCPIHTIIIPSPFVLFQNSSGTPFTTERTRKRHSPGWDLA